MLGNMNDFGGCFFLFKKIHFGSLCLNSISAAGLLYPVAGVVVVPVKQ